MIRLTVTRYFVSSEGHQAAIKSTFDANSGSEQKAFDLASQRVAVPDLPDLGTWREMTDEEAAAYVAEHEGED